MMSMPHSQRFRSSQSGFTLIELTMALLVGGMIMAAAGGTLYQILSNNTKNTARMLAVKQVENAMHFLVRDVQMAQTIETTGLGFNEVLRLTWREWDSSLAQVVYNWNPADHHLTRTQSVDNVTSTLAYSIDPRPIFLPGSGGTVSVNMTASVQGARETRVVKIGPRTGG